MAFLLSQHFIIKFRRETSYLTSSLNAEDSHTSLRILLKLINQMYSFWRWNTSIYPDVTSLPSTTREMAKLGQAPSYYIHVTAYFYVHTIKPKLVKWLVSKCCIRLLTRFLKPAYKNFLFLNILTCLRMVSSLIHLHTINAKCDVTGVTDITGVP